MAIGCKYDPWKVLGLIDAEGLVLLFQTSPIYLVILVIF